MVWYMAMRDDDGRERDKAQLLSAKEDTWAYCYFDEGEKGGGGRRGLAQRDQSQLQRHCHAQLMP